MRRIALFALVFGFLAPFLASAPAHAQATRTWVSGVGDDANPCSRTAPCKTFAGAISKTAAAGEINCLDPGGFGAVTITKSITLNCHEVFGSVLVAGTNGIVIAAQTTDKVTLRNIQVQGVNSGLAGIKILSAASVSIEDCFVMEFTQQGIADVRTSGGTLSVTNATLRNNAVGIGVAATGGTLNATIENTNAGANGIGLAAGAGNNVMVKRSNFSGNTGAGIEDDGGSITVDGSVMAGNGTGVLNNSGTIILSNNDIAFNTTGINGATSSFGENRISPFFSAGTVPTALGAASSSFAAK